MPFYPLNIASGHSFLGSALTIPRIVGLARKYGYHHIGLADHHTLSGFAEFHSTCLRGGLEPIFGLEVELKEGERVCLYVRNEDGYLNAIAIDYALSKGEIDLAFLKDHALGLLAVYDCDSPRLRGLMKEDPLKIPEYLASFSKGFEMFYLGLPYLPEEKAYPSFLRSFVEKYPYPLVAFPRFLYQKREDAIALEILQAIEKGEQLTEKAKSGFNHFLSKDEAFDYYREEENDLTEEIVKLCSSFRFQKKRGSLLSFCREKGEDEALLREHVLEGLKAKGKENDPAYLNRIEYELSVIAKMGYCSYFLLVEDYVKFALNNGISVGPGRGSGAGSLVSYCLDIVTVDPIQNDLMFERFLNPERQSMPDIDVDFADVRRDEVGAYLRQKYGQGHVAHIITFQTLGAKASLRDVGRVFGYEGRQIDLLAKTLPEVNGPTLAENYRKNEKFKSLVDSDPYYREIVSMAAKIEGLPRQSGIHAAGVVLNQEDLSTCVPVHYDPTWGLVAQFEMGYLESQGFLKMDLLGLRNLTYVDICLASLEKRGIKEALPRDIPYRDKEAIDLIASGKVMGLFQLESPGMRRTIKQFRPTSFEDVAAILALYRPGPMENIPSYIRRKEGKEKVTYLCPELVPILQSTYGIIVYQEQITQILTAMAGFTYGQADLFRRAISKKDASKMEALKGDFIQGCLNHKKSRGDAEKVYSLIYKFADYGFNKSHAYSYAVLTCQMAYLKSRYPLDFYAAILEGQSAGEGKFNALSSEIKQSGYRFLLPDVNHSEHLFSAGDGGIRFPLNAIKGINSYLCADIVDERIQNGPYADVYDFALRTKRFGLSPSSMVKLIDAGAFDSIHPNRESLRVSAESIVRYAEMFTGSDGNSLLLDLDFPKPNLVDIAPNKMDDLLAEKASLGIMISGSLLFSKEEVIKAKGLIGINELRNRDRGNLAAIISKSKTILTKNNKKMAFLTVYDDESEMELVAFDETIARDYSSIKEGNIVEVEARKDTRREGYIADRITLL